MTVATQVDNEDSRLIRLRYGMAHEDTLGSDHEECTNERSLLVC